MLSNNFIPLLFNSSVYLPLAIGILGKQKRRCVFYLHYFSLIAYLVSYSTQPVDDGVFWSLNYDKFHQHFQDRVDS